MVVLGPDSGANDSGGGGGSTGTGAGASGAAETPLLARIDALERQVLGQSGARPHLKPIDRLEGLEVELLRAPQKGGMVERVCTTNVGTVRSIRASILRSTIRISTDCIRIFHTTHDLL